MNVINPRNIINNSLGWGQDEILQSTLIEGHAQ